LRLVVGIFVPDGQEVFSFLRKQSPYRDDNRYAKPPTCLLTIFKRGHSLVWDLEAALLGIEEDEFVISSPQALDGQEERGLTMASGENVDAARLLHAGGRLRCQFMAP